MKKQKNKKKPKRKEKLRKTKKRLEEIRKQEQLKKEQEIKEAEKQAAIRQAKEEGIELEIIDEAPKIEKDSTDNTSDFKIKKQEDVKSKSEKKEKTNFGNEFHVFSAQGKLLNKHKISSQLYNFCISEKDGLIYAISYETDPKIIIYKL